MNEKELCIKFNQYPALKERFENLVAIIDNEDGQTTLANDAEQKIIDELRQTGKDTLQTWADHQANKSSHRLKKQKPHVRKHSKKKCAGIAVTEK